MSLTTDDIRFVIFGARGGYLPPSRLSRAKFYNIEVGFNYRFKFDKAFPEWAVTEGQKRLFLTELVDETIYMIESRRRKARERYKETPKAREAMRRRTLKERKEKEKLEREAILKEQAEILKDYPKPKTKSTTDYTLKDYYEAVMGAVRSNDHVFHKIIMEFKPPLIAIDMSEQTMREVEQDNFSPELQNMIDQIRDGFKILLKRLYQTGKGEKRHHLKILFKRYEQMNRKGQEGVINLGDVYNDQQEYQGYSMRREAQSIDYEESLERVDDLILEFLDSAFLSSKGKHVSFIHGDNVYLALGGLMIIDIAYEAESEPRILNNPQHTTKHKKEKVKKKAGYKWESITVLSLGRQGRPSG